jgi:hypothetical protein
LVLVFPLGEHEGMVVPIVKAGALHSMLGIVHLSTKTPETMIRRGNEEKRKRK